MKRIALIVLSLTAIVAVLVAATAGASAGPTASAASVTVKLKDSYFSPASKTVSRGTTVRFSFAGQLAHNITGGGVPKSWAHTRIKGSLSKSFTRAGKFKLVCTIHPGMDMTLRVR